MELNKLLSDVNIADSLDEQKLIKIGDEVVQGFETDLASRSHWEKDLEAWTELALQVAQKKTFPWPNAANVKFPLLATAAMQFQARAYPSLVPSNGKIVKCKVIGFDQTGEKANRADRISKHMSYQIMDEMDDWEEEMDRLLMVLPIVGTAFKKTYWDSDKQRNCSQLIFPKNLVVNYWAKSIEGAERKTEILEMPKRKLREKQLSGIYSEVDLPEPSVQTIESDKIKVSNMEQPDNDATTPYIILEQHTFLDLDDDGYAEPYIITVEYQSKKVLRIVARFSAENVQINEEGKIRKIAPTEYYTKFSFIPNPDGGFYDIGFGRLLGPINESVNTILNQLIDAGSLSNLQSGFIGKGLRIKMGETRFSPGEWKAVNATGDDIKKQIMPLPVRDPSQVLFNLLNLLVTSGKELASVAEIFVGKMPGQNTPATTTMASIEQGMKVFTAVYKRVFRSLAKEFRKIYLLNREYMNPQEEVDVLDVPIQQSDYLGSENDIVPAADPQAATATEKQAKSEQLLQLLGLGTIDPMEATRRALEAQEQPNIEALFRQPSPPPPDPKVEAIKMKAQMDQQKSMNDIQIAQVKAQMEQAAKEQELAFKQQLNDMELKFKAMEAMLKARVSQADAQSKIAQQAQQHRMDMITNQQSHKMQMQHTAESNKIKQQQLKSKSTSKKENK